MPPSTTEDKEHYYVLGWFLDDICKRMMELAGFEVKRRGEDGFVQTALDASYYVRCVSDYFHTWTQFVPKSEEGPNIPADFVEDEKDEGLWPFLVVTCSAPSAFCRRPSQAQFEWLKQVLGKEPHWTIIEQKQYSCGREMIWAKKDCCPSGSGVAHRVDLETMEWKSRMK